MTGGCGLAGLRGEAGGVRGCSGPPAQGGHCSGEVRGTEKGECMSHGQLKVVTSTGEQTLLGT